MKQGKTVANANARKAELSAKIGNARNTAAHGIASMADGTKLTQAEAINKSNIARWSAEVKRIDAFLAEYADRRKAAARKREKMAFESSNSVLPSSFRI